MNLNLKGFSALVSQFQTAVQGACAGLANFTTGSVNLSFGEASSSAGLWLQALAFKLQLYARAATCYGSDLDSWVNQFNVYRIGAQSAVGSLTFNRFSTIAPATSVPVGTVVTINDGSVSFAVTLDTALSSYDATTNSYDIASGVQSLSLPVMATTSGAAGNVAPNLVTKLITGGISAVDYVTNPAAMTGGAASETDPALRSRFVAFINSLSKGTAGAISYAILSLQLGINFQLVERQAYANINQVLDAYFYVVVDDGTGLPPTSLVTNVYNAVNAVRAFGIKISVFPPSVVNSTIAMIINIDPSYDQQTVIAQVFDAVSQYANTLPLGANLDYFKVSQIAYDASPGMTSINSLLINGGSASVIATPRIVNKAPTVSVNPS